MGIFYKATNKELREIRNNIFLDKALPLLLRQGFSVSPFSTSWFGKDDNGGYTYELCRIKQPTELQVLTIYICMGDSWIQEHLNIFSVIPSIETLEELRGTAGLQFHLPPNRNSLVRLSKPDGWFFKGQPQHRIKRYYTKAGFRKRCMSLEQRILIDLGNIEPYIERWHAMHSPRKSDWNGNAV